MANFLKVDNFSENLRSEAKIQQTKMLVTSQRSGDLFLFGPVWQYKLLSSDKI